MMREVRNEKKCKRKNCPYYHEQTTKCSQCDWNPDSVWTVGKKGEKECD